MLPKPHRLKKENDFKKTLKKGKACKEGFLFLKRIKNNLEASRFGFVVSVSVSKKATVRNKIKRKLREITRKKLSKIKEGNDVVIIVQPEFRKSDIPKIENNLIQLYKKAGLIKNSV